MQTNTVQNRQQTEQEEREIFNVPLTAAAINVCDQTFARLVESYQASMFRIACQYVSDPECAADVVQETWLAAMRGLAHFEERSSFKTWLFAILIKRAQSYWKREKRYVCFSEWQREPFDRDDWDEIAGGGQGREYMAAIAHEELPDETALAHELYRLVEESIATLPEQQRIVITLHDLTGWTHDEICTTLQLRAGNVRVLLHRARMKVRQALQEYLEQLV